MNLVGPRVRRIRWERKLRQKDLAAKLEIAGWPLDRAGVSKVESGFIKVSDRQLLYLMHVLKVEAHELLPAIDPNNPIGKQIKKFKKSKQ
jgi:transcriptional regulator with XRE-family HTH domain